METSKQTSHTNFIEDTSIHYPGSTYRIQFNKFFTFNNLLENVQYLHDLGITTIYAAPITKAVTDSLHGYDVADASQINPQIGTLDELKNLSQELKKYNMTWIQDIVPNHMAVSLENLKLMDVLERGKSSLYYNYFDIDWNQPDSIGKIILPDLGRELEACIEAGEIALSFNNNGFQIAYFDHVYPLSISAIPTLISILEGKKIHEDFLREIHSYKKRAEVESLEEWKKN